MDSRIVRRHVAWFGHPYSHIKLPICRVCKTPITADIWLKNSPCPGSLDDQFARALAETLQGTAER
jgi:hypothetical protein